MEFPITELLNYEQSVEWIKEYFHNNDFKCPYCEAPVDQAREYRQTKRSQVLVYRCRVCDAVYNLYTGTVFQQRHLTPMQAVLFMRRLCKGESSKMLAAELDLDYKTVLELRHIIQDLFEALPTYSPVEHFLLRQAKDFIRPPWGRLW